MSKVTPRDREEKLLAAIADGTAAELPTPRNRKEKLLKEIYDNGGGGGGGGESTIAWKPEVDTNGNISWERTVSTVKPATQNIKGPQGEKGEQGLKGDPGEQGKPGRDGTNYVLTEDDKHEIAEMAKPTENLLIINDFDETFNGVNIRIVNNHITLSGTCVANGGININCRAISISGTHILSAQNCTASAGLSATLAKDNVTISDTALSLNKTGNISSAVSNFTFNQIRLYFTKDRAYEKEFDIQLEIGEELHSFVAPSELSRLSNITENMLSSDLQKKLFTISFDDETGELNILTNEVL